MKAEMEAFFFFHQISLIFSVHHSILLTEICWGIISMVFRRQT
uniref:Uncharacterized protein n=1 Tax=Rhizophora mucronata TaxID=61149 RepID=A0A2P2J9K8_RHIMU